MKEIGFYRPEERAVRVVLVFDMELRLYNMIRLCAIYLCVLFHTKADMTQLGRHVDDISITIKGHKEKLLFAALQNTHKSYPLTSRHPLIVGFGACLDAIVHHSDFLSAMDVDVASLQQEPHAFIDNAQQLVELFLFYFARGSSAERYITSSDLHSSLIHSAHSSSSTVWSLGGNAALMANKLAHLASFLHSNITIIKPSHIDVDDIHYIVEYRKNDRVGDVTAPRANRLALHRDVNNMNLVSIDAINDFAHLSPAAVVIGGIQLMQFSVVQESVARSALQKIADMYQRYTDNAQGIPPLHFELASISSVPFMQSVVNILVKEKVTSIGCNEQEVGMLHDFLVQPNSISLEQDPYPSPSVIFDKMRIIFGYLNENGKYLQRIHVHTVAFQVIMTPAEVAGRVPLVGGGYWDSEAGVKAASLAATQWVCGDKREEGVHLPLEATSVLMDYTFLDSLNDDMATMIVLDDENPVMCWTDKYGMHVCIAAQLVCQAPLLTIGAGDNISAAALVPVE